MSANVAISVAQFPAPTTLDQTGLAPDQIEMLMVKVLHGGEATGLTVADRLRLPWQRHRWRIIAGANQRGESCESGHRLLLRSDYAAGLAAG